MATRRRSDGRWTSRAQALVEFALIIPVFFLILFGLLDLGAFVYSDSVMSQASREGARVGSTQAAWIGVTSGQEPGCANNAPVCPASEAAMVTNITAAIKNASAGLTAPTTVQIRCDPAGSPPAPNWAPAACGPNNTAGSLISVKVVYTYNPLTPVGRTLLGTPSLGGSATMVIN